MATGSTLRLTASLAALVVSCPAMAATITLYNTGVDASGTPLASLSPELHYQVISSPVGAFTPTAIDSSFTVPGYTALPFSQWLGDNGISNWISTTPMGLAPSGIYDFRLSFSLAGLDAASASISGRVAADDWLNDVLLNGASTGISAGVNDYSTGAYTAWTPFTISSGFQSGTNTLDFIVNNYFDTSATGLRVEMAGSANTASGAVPEPASWAMMILGLGVAGAALRRQRQNVSTKISFA